MAIFFDNKYYKIADSTLSDDKKSVLVDMDVYNTIEDRMREKNLAEGVKIFKEKARNHVTSLMEELIEQTNSVQDIKTILNREIFLQMYPDIKIKVEQIEDLRREALLLIDSLGKENIDFESLKYRDKWSELGLNKEMCKKLGFAGTFSLELKCVCYDNLAELYNTIKSRIVSPVLDC